MKKYLMTGVAAVAMCAAFTSCSKNENLYDPGAAQEMEIASVYEQYNQAFIKTFGQVHPNQNWGFGKRSATRGYNPDANIWGSRYGLDVPQVITEAQRQRVIAYFQSNKFLTGGGSKPLTEYFVQQVYKGGENNGQYVNIMNTNPANTTEQYKSAGMTSPQYGSNHMDKLFANNDPNDHMGNYNGGTMSWNYNVENTNPRIQYLNDQGNNQHADQIMYMINTQATGFGYHCSEPSIQYDDHYKLVDGADIDAWAEANGGIGASVSGRAFVGFDFDLLTPDDWYTNDNFKITDLSSAIGLCTDLDGKAKKLADVGLNGDYVYNQQPVKYLHQNATNMISGDIIYSVDNKCGMQDLQQPIVAKTFSRSYIDNLIKDGYRPVKGAPSTWIKPEITRDYYYSDWIVSIIPGKTSEKEYDVRIMAEDLEATAGDGDIENSDWDFNDVVFDVKFDAEGDGAWITLVAAGGVLPLYVAGQEVHKKFDSSLNQDEKGWYPMINTGKGITRDKAKFHIDNADKANDGRGILIQVEKKLKDGTWKTFTLDAKQGQPAAKFAVDPSVGYCSERVSIDKVSNGNFSRGVKDGSILWW